MQVINPSSRAAIIEAAFLVFNDNPGASLADVATKAGVGRATLHRHFSARQDLIDALAQIAMDELDAAVDAATADATSHIDALRVSLIAIVPLAPRQWFLSHELFEDENLIQRYSDSMAELRATIAAAQTEGAIAADLPALWAMSVYDNLIYAAWLLVRDKEATAAQAADLAWRSFLNGVST